MTNLKNFLILINLANKTDKIESTKTAAKIITNLKNVSKRDPKNIWADGAYFGFAFEFDGTAADAWMAITTGVNENISVKDMLIFELGRDWMCRNEAAAHGWFNSHLGVPLPRTSQFRQNK